MYIFTSTSVTKDGSNNYNTLMEYMKKKSTPRHPHLLSALHETRLPQSHYLESENRKQQIGDEKSNCGTSSALNTRRSKPTDVLISALPIN